ncbi:CDP-diacylglycerol--glycerol-3-phosphate 3-phosphatidyltransferase [Pirellula sp. SH-Sr6A]|uniref:CDP-diacylglycerol--glycerol-3-phosphate 3-phosphatidyltransferase n=1 Tax=Pirellula sp. SH-Sr6A TaxID=1632865 RepID=UPI00078C4468|nr:CDP-diacylglycerol--glycerol-3-phosphate 3-phosphatidyltransferase [Pirellula sp. SH-Sr6A]AMV32879.1 CDP-diacylglycerol--glycerol-3-phosphate 3-phosphatidyltransferase [Pirellula sp. SH-Sr6A]
MSDRDLKLSSNWNVPNALSGLRLLLSFGVFYLIEAGSYLPAMICFLIAASTDWIDGWWARRFNQVTKLGRILDPFVDKIIICGAMIAIAAIPNSPLRPWMATLVVGRELLVTSLRAMVEGQGGDFSAKQLGKWKMVLQCAAVAMVLFQFYQGDTSPIYRIATQAVVYLAMGLTVISGLEYVMLVVRKPRG